jgi:hypothetical protein
MWSSRSLGIGSAEPVRIVIVQEEGGRWGAVSPDLPDFIFIADSRAQLNHLTAGAVPVACAISCLTLTGATPHAVINLLRGSIVFAILAPVLKRQLPEWRPYAGILITPLRDVNALSVWTIRAGPPAPRRRLISVEASQLFHWGDPSTLAAPS